jgi:Tfp pilus assembly protein PilF
VLLLVGRTYATSNDFATAEKFFRQAIAADSSMTVAYAALGGIYLRQGRTTEALTEFQSLAAASPKSITAQTMVAALLEAQGRKAEAKKAYQKVLDIDPNAVVASNNLAWLMVEDNENVDKALSLVQAARSRLPGSPDIADTLGWIYYKKGMYSLSVASLKEAVQKQPTNPEFLYHLGFASARNGEDLLARQHLERALKLSPNSSYAAEAKIALPRLRVKS